MTSDILHIEAHSFLARPALETRYYDGWVLRFADGFTRRANSVNPLYGSDMPLDAKISLCEDLYHRHDLPPVFRLTDTAQPADLDDHLASRGYQHQPGALVQVCDLTTAHLQADATCQITPQPTLAWWEACARLNAIPPDKMRVFERTMAITSGQTAYSAIYDANGAIIVLGQGVYKDDLLGIFAVVTAEEHRRQGLARQLMMSLLAWGWAQGAAQAYLQVTPENTAAITLYAGLGFQPAYSYWYRQRP
jgi:N-acetylglutamate synthase